jgi:hypothetical protein
VSDVNNLRRYYLLKRIECFERQDFELSSVWQSAQEAQPGDLLPVTFPFNAKLAPVGYIAKQDFDGADVDELARHVKISTRDATAILAAAAAL